MCIEKILICALNSRGVCDLVGESKRREESVGEQLGVSV